MVYSGKPSAACRACKQKKIKCDEERPRCGQCIKYRRECGYAYADRNDILFQNETTLTLRRASKSKRSKSQASTPSQSEQLPEGPVALLDNPPQSVDTAALSFYLEGMIVTPTSHGRHVGHLDVLPRMYLKAGANSALAKATRSTCLAAFSTIGAEDSPISQRALEAYGESVAAIYQASKDLELRTQNETLLAILVMLVNEALLARYTAPQQQWTMHTLGAMQLILMRGPTILNDPVGVKLFQVVRGFLLEGAEEQSLPPLFHQSEIQPIHKGPEARLGALVAVLYRLRTSVLSALSCGGPIADLRTECQALDDALEQWTKDLPEDCRYTGINQDKYHYRDGHNLRLWNHYRCTRIWANVLAYRCLQEETSNSPGSPFDAPEAKHYVQNLHRMADEISASLPDELLGVTGSPVYSSAKSTTRAVMEPFVQGSITAWCLVWPLYLARGILSMPQSQRDWFRSRMLIIADKYRYRQAAHLVEISDADPTLPLYVDTWDDDRIENVWEKTLEYGSGAV